MGTRRDAQQPEQEMPLWQLEAEPESGAGLVQILTNATAPPKCIYILSVLFTHMFNKSLFII